MRNWGVHSEVGILRTVLVCRPGLAHQRLTPGNCHELLHDLLAKTLEKPEARRCVLDRRMTANTIGPGCEMGLDQGLGGETAYL